MGTLRTRSVLEGAVYALLISGGAGIAQAVVDNASLRGLLFLLIIFGYLFGGFVAGRGNFGSATRHGAAAAATAFLVFQGLASARRLINGDDVSIIGIVFNAVTAAVCGSLGGMLATRSPGPDAVRRTRGDLDTH